MNNTTEYNRLIKKDNPYTQILNNIITDTRISSNAFRLICYFISKPNDWKINLTEAYDTLDIGRDAGARAFKDLESVGYLNRTQIRTDKGLVGYNYILNETVAGFLDSSKGATINTNINNTKEKKEEVVLIDCIKEERKELSDIFNLSGLDKYKATTKYISSKTNLSRVDEPYFGKMRQIIKESKESSSFISKIECLIKEILQNPSKQSETPQESIISINASTFTLKASDASEEGLDEFGDPLVDAKPAQPNKPDLTLPITFDPDYVDYKLLNDNSGYINGRFYYFSAASKKILEDAYNLTQKGAQYEQR